MLIPLDFETYYDKEYSLGKMTTEEYIRSPQFEPLILGLRHPVTKEVHSLEVCEMSRTEVRDILHDEYRLHEGMLLCQNTMFDAAILNWHYGVRPKMYADTMLMSRLLLRHRSGSTSLAAIADLLGAGQKGREVVSALGKHREHFTDDEWQKYREYCENDVLLTESIFRILLPYAPRRELEVMHTTLRWYVEPTLELDVSALRQSIEHEKSEYQKLLQQCPLDNKQLSSNKQFAEWLESRGVTVPTKLSPRTGMPIPAIAKADTAFRDLADNHPDPVVRAACLARLGAKSRIKETRLERFAGIADRNANKLPVPLLYSGAHTHRYAGMEKINLQNLPHGPLRECIVAPPGHVVMSADQGQIEARLNAVLSGQHDLVEGFRNDEDVYIMMAERIYGREVHKQDHERKVGKAAVLGCGYGMGGDRAYDFFTGQWGISDMTREFAHEIIQIYRTEMHAIKANWRRVDDLLHVLAYGGEEQYGPVVFRKEHIELPSGVRMYYPEMHYDANWQSYRYRRYDRRSRRWDWVKIYGAMMVENLCQALARELLTDQLVTLDKRYRSVHQIHDEIVFVVPEGEAKLAAAVMKRVMEIPPAWLPELPLKVEPAYGRSLGDCK